MCNWERLAVTHPSQRLSPPGLHHFKLVSPHFLTILANCLYLDFLRFPPTVESGGRNELNGGAGAMCPERLCQCFREQFRPDTFHEICSWCVRGFPWENLCVHMYFLGSQRLPGSLAALCSAHHYFRKISGAWKQSSYKISLSFEDIITHPQIRFSPEAVKRIAKEWEFL